MRFFSPLRSAQNDIPDYLTFARGLVTTSRLSKYMLVNTLDSDMIILQMGLRSQHNIIKLL